MGENNPMFGKHLSEEQKQLRREKMSGKNNHMFGKNLTKEHKNKISRANRGRKRSLYLRKSQEKYIYKVFDANNKQVNFLLFDDFCKSIGGKRVNISWKCDNSAIYKGYRIFRILK